MLKDQKVFAYSPVSDLAQAREFYEGKLGLEPDGPSVGGVTYKGAGGTAFFVYVSPGAGTSKASTLFWTVDDIDVEVALLKSKGVEFEKYDSQYMKTDENDIARPPADSGATPAAWFKDPDGNILALIQS